MTFDVKEHYEQKRGALIKTETQEFYNIEGLRVYAKLDIYEGGSAGVVNVYNKEELVAGSIFGVTSYDIDHSKYCRTELNKYLKSKDFKFACKNFAAKYIANAANDNTKN